ncbi:MAG: universal stress protein [Actinomycetota bacterium]
MKVMYAVDGSAASEAAASLLEALFDRSELEVSVVSVAEAEPILAERDQSGPVRIRVATDHARQAVERIVDRLRSAGFTVEGEVLKGRPGPAVLDAAQDGAVDLIVVGAGRHSWFGNTLLGSTSTHVLHLSQTSVLVVHGPVTPSRPVRLLVGTDGSASANHVVGLLGQLADPERCEVAVLSIVQVPQTAALAYAGGSAGDPVDSAHVQGLVDQANSRADEAATMLRNVGFRVETMVRNGSAHHLILEEADQGNFDLVVVGSRKHGEVQRSPLGSVSESVVRHSNAALIGRRR